MKKSLILNVALFTALLFVSSCYPDKQRNPQPQYPVQEYVFDEEFNNDQNGWSFADPANLAYGVVSNGTFKFDYNDYLFEAYYVPKYFGFNADNDFSIEARIGSNNNMGVLFGYDDQKGAYGYSFTIDYDGYYALYDEGGNGYGADLTTLVEPETRNFVRPNGDWNDVKIIQRGHQWIGYVNNIQVFTVQAQNIVGTGIGFVDVAQTQGEADYLEVHWYE